MTRVAKCALLIAAGALPVAFAAAAPILESASYVTPSGISRLIGEHGRWNESCRALETPFVSLERAAGHGSVCVRRDLITLTQSRSGRAVNCVGRKLSGVHVVYRPQPGFTGTDTLRYGLDFPEGHLSREIAIEIQPRASAPARLPFDEASPPQAAGRVPDCPGESS